jgi:hypothetical protein
MHDNLRKEGNMAVGQVGFYDEKAVRLLLLPPPPPSPFLFISFSLLPYTSVVSVSSSSPSR